MSAISGSLALVTFVGAARADATPEQVAALKTCIEPLRDKSLSTPEAYRACMERVIEVMGPEWKLTGEWADQIDAFLKDG